MGTQAINGLLDKNRDIQHKRLNKQSITDSQDLNIDAKEVKDLKSGDKDY